MSTGMKKNIKGGRPRLGKVRRKDKAVTVRYGSLEYDIVCYRARQAGYRRLAEYVRQASVHAEVKQNIIQRHNDAFRDMAGLCNNLNQLTKLAHAQGLSAIEVTIAELLPQIKTLINKLIKDIKTK